MDAFDTPGSVSLRIKLPSGRVVVTTVDEPKTSVELVSLGRRGHDALGEVSIRHDDRGGRHLVTIEREPRFRWGPLQITWDDALEVRVACPPGTNLELSTAAASARAGGDLGDVAVKTASGDVHLDVVGGSLGVKTASGDVTVVEARGGGTVRTVSGDVRIERAARTLAIRSVSGGVAVATASAPLTVSTTSGDIRVERVEGGEVVVQSISGDARLGVAPGTRVWVDATSVSGTLESQLGLEDRPRAASDGDVVPMRITTVSGDVSIAPAADLVAAGAG